MKIYHTVKRSIGQFVVDLLGRDTLFAYSVFPRAETEYLAS